MSHDEEESKPRPASGSRIPIASTFLLFSGAFWAAYAVPMRRKEWVDILLDYSHHKRTRFVPGLLDRSATMAMRLLRIR